VPGGGVEPPRPEGPAGLSRLRLPFRHPGSRRGYVATPLRRVVRDGMEELSPEASGGIAVEPVHADETFDHVDDNIVEGPAAQGDGDDGPVGVAAQGPASPGDPGWGPEGRDAQAGGPGCGTESARSLGELDCR
jgi:hypothetical protein